ncbi:group III truncated hemoglobin [Massilia brevitalea]|uniref:group III truncated hemoglobin n=1 Tax=Massilia brevitalea TaxID=442526 RepID=UPI002739B30C|nr:group III truncated hemoglobin [Massilia brevitalea]
MSSEVITELSIRKVVDVFYERVRKDVVLGPVFESHLAGKWDTHLPRMYAFWTKALLGTGDFQGNVFGKHMALSSIEKEHFVRWLTLFRMTSIEIFGAETAQPMLAVAQRIASSLQLGLFGEVKVQ